MRRVFEGLVAVMDGWMQRTSSRRPGKPGDVTWWQQHEKAFVRIPDDAPIFGGREIAAAEIAAEHARLREEHAGGHRTRLWHHVLLAALIAGSLYYVANEVMEAIAARRIGKLVFETLGYIALMFALTAFWTALSRRAERGIRRVCDKLGADGGLDRTKAVLDWVNRHWAWLTPPALFKGEIADVQGVRRGHPFLLLSENEAEYPGEVRELRFRSAIQRTCVFVAGHGGSPGHLGVHILPGRELPIQVAVTPAGLFAYWGGASLLWEPHAEQWERLLDGLLDLADREHVKAPEGSLEAGRREETSRDEQRS